MPNNTEEWRHACECKHWLDHTGGNGPLVKDVIARITNVRGSAAGEYLHRGMQALYPHWKAARK